MGVQYLLMVKKTLLSMNFDRENGIQESVSSTKMKN